MNFILKNIMFMLKNTHNIINILLTHCTHLLNIIFYHSKIKFMNILCKWHERNMTDLSSWQMALIYTLGNV